MVFRSTHSSCRPLSRRQGPDVGVYSTAFGSLHHTVLEELFATLQIPEDLQRILADIYLGNRMDFDLGKESGHISPTAGVRQSNALSAPIFNLASEPLARAGKSTPDLYYMICSSRPRNMLTILPWLQILVMSSKKFYTYYPSLPHTLGLKFNVGKCACLVIGKGKPSEALLRISTQPIRCLGPDDQETYLDTSIGGKFRFRSPTDLIPNLDKIGTSALTPWQKFFVLTFFSPFPTTSFRVGS